jgi:hypothetical protein
MRCYFKFRARGQHCQRAKLAVFLVSRLTFVDRNLVWVLLNKIQAFKRDVTRLAKEQIKAGDRR